MAQTVTRAVAALRFVAETPRSLGEVAVFLDVHKSTALRLLQTLQEESLARLLPTGRYTVGLGVMPLAYAAMASLDIPELAHPHLKRLAARVGHTVHLGQLMGSQVVYIDKIDGNANLTLGSRVGLPADIHTAAVAKVILAQLAPEEADGIINGLPFTRFTDTTITDPDAYRAELDAVRADGWAKDDGEREPYIACVALPVHEASGAARLGMSVTALRSVTPLDELVAQLPDFRAVAEAISRDLGWRGSSDDRH